MRHSWRPVVSHPDGLLKEIKQYVAQETLNYSKMPLSNIDKNSNYQILPITQTEAKRVLQDLLVLVTKYRQSEH